MTDVLDHAIRSTLGTIVAAAPEPGDEPRRQIIREPHGSSRQVPRSIAAASIAIACGVAGLALLRSDGSGPVSPATAPPPSLPIVDAERFILRLDGFPVTYADENPDGSQHFIAVDAGASRYASAEAGTVQVWTGSRAAAQREALVDSGVYTAPDLDATVNVLGTPANVYVRPENSWVVVWQSPGGTPVLLNFEGIRQVPVDAVVSGLSATTDADWTQLLDSVGPDDSAVSTSTVLEIVAHSVPST